MTIYLALLALATLLVTLVAGFLVAFLLIVMPGLARLPDAEFIRGFQTIDGIIQDGEPRFLTLWLGSAVVLLAAAVAGWFALPSFDATLVTAAATLYIAGLQLPTVTKNIPLNNALQRIDTQAVPDESLADARAAFEAPWNRWNAIRTGVALATSALLLLVLVRQGPVAT
ncbi:MAG: DUF1772 domain-containing protein [Planctomycetota bacterium]